MTERPRPVTTPADPPGRGQATPRGHHVTMAAANPPVILGRQGARRRCAAARNVTHYVGFGPSRLVPSRDESRDRPGPYVVPGDLSVVSGVTR
jgi:hypothetical protein